MLGLPKPRMRSKPWNGPDRRLRENPSISPFENEILSLLRQGQKIGAIKLYREKTGVGLKEAKDFIEALAADQHIAAPSGSGCLGIALFLMVILSMLLVAPLVAEDHRPLEFRTIAFNGDKGGMLAVVDGNPSWSIPVLPGRNGLCEKPIRGGQSRVALAYSENKPTLDS